MKSRIFPVMLAVLLMFTFTVPAMASERAIRGGPDLSIYGTTAYCTGKYDSGNNSDRISIKVTLKQGTDTLKSWSATGLGSAVVSETWTVRTGKTYTLVLAATVNGVAQPEQSTTAKS